MKHHYIASLISKILRGGGISVEGGYFGFSAEGGIFWKITPLKKREKIGSSAFSVIKALIKLN